MYIFFKRVFKKIYLSCKLIICTIFKIGSTKVEYIKAFVGRFKDYILHNESIDINEHDLEDALAAADSMTDKIVLNAIKNFKSVPYSNSLPIKIPHNSRCPEYNDQYLDNLFNIAATIGSITLI